MGRRDRSAGLWNCGACSAAQKGRRSDRGEPLSGKGTAHSDTASGEVLYPAAAVSLSAGGSGSAAGILPSDQWDTAGDICCDKSRAV